MKSMTIPNIMAGFSTAGIYPLDRNKVISKLEEAMLTPPKQSSKLSYLPLLTPVPSPSRSQSSKRPIVFSEAEIKLFLERYEDGYDGGDERYKIWLKMYHPDADSVSSTSLNESIFHIPKQAIKTKEDSKIAHVVAISKPTRKIDKMFSKPMPPSKLPTKSEKSSGRVLTSSEALKILQEKEEKKSAAKKQKELRRKKTEKKSQQQLQKMHNDIKETVEESIKIKGNQGTKN